MAGRPDEPRASRLTWEGLTYRVDLFGSERARLGRIREQIDSPGLDLAIASGDNEKMASALLALIYTPALGDPEGPALLGADIAQRHNFGLTGAAGLRHESLAWDAPREQVGDGGPWRVDGSILGLDLALARIALRRIADNDMPTAPTINNTLWAASGAGALSDLSGISEAKYAANSTTHLTTGTADNALYVSETWNNGTLIRVQLPQAGTGIIPPVAGDTVTIQWGSQSYDVPVDRKSTRLNSSHIPLSRMPSSA